MSDPSPIGKANTGIAFVDWLWKATKVLFGLVTLGAFAAGAGAAAGASVAAAGPQPVMPTDGGLAVGKTPIDFSAAPAVAPRGPGSLGL